MMDSKADICTDGGCDGKLFNWAGKQMYAIDPVEFPVTWQDKNNLCAKLKKDGEIQDDDCTSTNNIPLCESPCGFDSKGVGK